MNSKPKKGDGICILSFDGGGPGSLSQLQIMEEFLARLEFDLGVDPADLFLSDLFDVIGGTGFGGYLALLLGPLRMSVTEATDELMTLGATLFPNGEETPNPEENTTRLRQVIEEMLERRQVPIDIKLRDGQLPGSQCKAVLFASTSVSATQVRLFRSYSSRERSFDCTLVEAVCATLAIPTFFAPVPIGPASRQQKFISASFGYNNPTKELIKEAEKAFGPESRVALILSVGAGRPSKISLETNGSLPEDPSTLLTRVLVDCEKVAQELSTQLFDIGAYLRLSVDDGLSDIQIWDWEAGGDIESHTKDYIDVPAVTKAIDLSLRSLHDRIGSVTLSQLNRSTGIKIQAKSVPAVSPYFVMRKAHWDSMVEHLVMTPEDKRKIFVLSGMGGCGKTQMVSYFAHENRHRYTHTFFVDASSRSSIRGDLQAAIRSLGTGYQQKTYEDGIAFLNSESNWFLILDNADDPSLDLVPFLPTASHGTIIITTRNPDVGRLSTTMHLQLGPMGDEEAFETLTRAAHRSTPLYEEEEERFAQLLTEELGNLAVALVQAGSYCYKMSSDPQFPFTFEKYLELLKKHRAKLMEKADENSLDHYRRGVYATLDLSYDALSPPSQQFLHLTSFFHHSDIPLTMLAYAVQNDFPDTWKFLDRPESHATVMKQLKEMLSPDGRWNELHAHEIIHSLRSFSLVTITVVEKTVFLRFHPLVHSWGRDRLKTAEETAIYRQMATHVVVSCTPRSNIPSYRFLQPHVVALTDTHPVTDFHPNDQVAFGRVFSDLGRLHKAAALFKEAKGTVEGTLGRDHVETYKIRTRLASAYHRLGKLNDAEELDLEIWENLKRLLGDHHPDSLWAGGNLAGTYRKTGKWEEAVSIHREVLGHRRRLFGREHPDSINSASWLAQVYHSQGLWDQCEKIEVEVLALRTKVLGREHRDTMTAAHNLALTYAKQSRWEEAETLGNEVLEQRQTHLGKEHRYTITATAHMAEVYCAQERWNDAERLGMEVWEQRQKVLGKDNPDTILAAAKLFEIYFKRGRQKEAEDLQGEVLEMCQKVLGNEHPTTKVIKGLAASSNLSSPSEDKESENVKVIEEQRPQLPSPPPSSYFGFFSRMFQLSA